MVGNENIINLPLNAEKKPTNKQLKVKWEHFKNIMQWKKKKKRALGGYIIFIIMGISCQ